MGDGTAPNGSHSYSLQNEHWRLLGYGSRLSGSRIMNAKLCRALALRLETRHRAAARVHRSIIWPTAVSWCCPMMVDLPSDADRPTNKGSTGAQGVTPRGFANTNLMLWRSVAKLAAARPACEIYEDLRGEGPGAGLLAQESAPN